MIWGLHDCAWPRRGHPAGNAVVRHPRWRCPVCRQRWASTSRRTAGGRIRVEWKRLGGWRWRLGGWGPR